MVVAMDAMGGDNAPKVIVEGALLATNCIENLKIILLGKEQLIKQHLENYNGSSIEILNTTQTVENDDVPTVAIKQKKDSSMVVGLNLLKQKKADAFISAGNTGALLTGATIIVGRLEGIERPAIGTVLPNKNKTYTLLIDSGANVDCKPSYILQFAKMGSVYMENVLNIKNPTVGLLNVGTEDKKGNSLVKECFTILKECQEINFFGNVEASTVSYGTVDVLVCDGFVGNVFLKQAEGLSKMILSVIKDELMSSFMAKIGAALAKGAFENVKKRFDSAEIGGAPFLGLNALVVKAHGNSNEREIFGAVRQCVNFVNSDIVSKIKQKL